MVDVVRLSLGVYFLLSLPLPLPSHSLFNPLLPAATFYFIAHHPVSFVKSAALKSLNDFNENMAMNRNAGSVNGVIPFAQSIRMNVGANNLNEIIHGIWLPVIAGILLFRLTA